MGDRTLSPIMAFAFSRLEIFALPSWHPLLAQDPTPARSFDMFDSQRFWASTSTPPLLARSSSCSSMMVVLWLAVGLIPLSSLRSQEPTPDPFHRFDALIREYCVDCHRPDKLEGDLDLSSLSAPEQIAKHRSQWDKVQARVFAGEMPPKDAKGMKVEDRQWFADYITRVFRSVACKDGPVPGPYRMRRLNRLQFGNSIRDLLQAHFDAGAALPVDGAGGEGFDNAAETLFLSPVHGEKYLDAANDAFDYVAKNEASRKLLLIAKPSENKSEEEAAKECLAEYASRPIVARFAIPNCKRYWDFIVMRGRNVNCLGMRPSLMPCGCV